MPRARAVPRTETADPLDPLRAFLRSRIAEGLVPGVVFALGKSGGRVHVEALGHRGLKPRPETMTERTIFDLASLTKPMATAPLLAELAVRGKVGLEDPLERYLAETVDTPVGSSSLRSLLTHTSGLPAMNPIEDYAGTKERLYAAIAREPLEAEPGRRLIYSDVGYVLAQGVVERLTKKSLDRLARERIFSPLGFRD